MQKLLEEIVPILFGKGSPQHPIDNIVFRLHYRVTVAGLVAAAILVSIFISQFFLLCSTLFPHFDDSLPFCRQAVTITWIVAAVRFSAWSEKATAKLSHRCNYNKNNNISFMTGT